jgi:hypothetical protein
LLADGVGGLTWTFAGTDPVHWEYSESPDGSTAWAVVTEYPGADRADDAITPGVFCRLQGVDAGLNPVTDFSNVQPTGSF